MVMDLLTFTFLTCVYLHTFHAASGFEVQVQTSGFYDTAEAWLYCRVINGSIAQPVKWEQTKSGVTTLITAGCDIYKEGYSWSLCSPIFNIYNLSIVNVSLHTGVWTCFAGDHRGNNWSVNVQVLYNINTGWGMLPMAEPEPETTPEGEPEEEPGSVYLYIFLSCLCYVGLLVLILVLVVCLKDSLTGDCKECLLFCVGLMCLPCLCVRICVDECKKCKNRKIGTTDQKVGTTGHNVGTTAQNVGTTRQNLGTTGQTAGTTGQNVGTTGQTVGTTGQTAGTTGQNVGTTGPNVGTTGQNVQKVGTTRENVGITWQSLRTKPPNLRTKEESIGPTRNIELILRNLQNLNFMQEIDWDTHHYNLIKQLVNETWIYNKQLGKHQEIIVKSILRVHNTNLYAAYERIAPVIAGHGYHLFQRKYCLTYQFQLANGIMGSHEDELYLFHGTPVENASNIVQHGFDLDRANEGIFGRAIYMSDSCVKVDQYSDKGNRRMENLSMILARVRVGRVYKHNGHGMMGIPDIGASTEYDSVVAGSGCPFKEFLIYDSQRILPEYVIIYDRK